MHRRGGNAPQLRLDPLPLRRSLRLDQRDESHLLLAPPRCQLKLRLRSLTRRFRCRDTRLRLGHCVPQPQLTLLGSARRRLQLLLPPTRRGVRVLESRAPLLLLRTQPGLRRGAALFQPRE